MDVDNGREEITVEGGNSGKILFIYCYFKIMKRTEKNSFSKIDNFVCSAGGQKAGEEEN